MYLEHPVFLKDILHTITYFAIPIHIFGTYCILFKTPKTMGSVKWIMLNFHVWCMCLDYGLTVLTVPIVIFPALGGYPFGILTEWGVSAEFQTYLIVTLIPVVSAAVITIFENRYFLVFGHNSKWRRFRVLLSIFNYLYAATWCLPSFMIIPEQNMARKVALEMLGPNVSDYIRHFPIFMMSLEITYLTLPCLLIVLTFATEVILFVAIIKKGMTELAKTARFSKNTLKMQKNFLKAVYIQVSMYMTSIQLPLAYFFVSIFFKIYNQSANNFCFVVFSLNGLSSTILMLWVHTPYRDFCYKLLRIEKWRKKIGQANSQDNVVSVAPTAAPK